MHLHNSVVGMSNEGTSDGLNRYVIVGGGIAGVSCAEEVTVQTIMLISYTYTLHCTIQVVFITDLGVPDTRRLMKLFFDTCSSRINGCWGNLTSFPFPHPASHTCSKLGKGVGRRLYLISYCYISSFLVPQPWQFPVTRRNMGMKSYCLI